MAEPVPHAEHRGGAAAGSPGEWMREKAQHAKEAVEGALGGAARGGGDAAAAARHAAEQAPAAAQDKAQQAKDTATRTVGDQARSPRRLPLRFFPFSRRAPFSSGARRHLSRLKTRRCLSASFPLPRRPST